MSAEVQELEIRDASGLRIAIARARFNGQITAGLAEGATNYLDETHATFAVYETPGAFELPLVAQRLLAAGYDGVVALGAVIEGGTDHYEHVAHRASEGLMRVMLDTGKPVAFGMLTVRDEEQALVRSRPGPGNKGAEAAAALVETVLLMRTIAEAEAIR